MTRRILPAALLLIMSLMTARAYAALDVLIVDPGHTDTGDTVASALKSIPDATVDKVDVPGLRDTRAENRSAIIWIGPEPTLLTGDNGKLWNSILADKSAGLMILGLPSDDKGRAAMFAALKDRGHPAIGVKLGYHLEKAWWIWNTDKPKDNTDAWIRKTFDVPQVPARTYIQASADNKSRIIVNGKEVGHADVWKQPISFDVTKLIHAGKNVIAVEAYNEDGPAGVIERIIGTSAAGEKVLDLPTDKTWKSSTTKPSDETWTAADYDDSKWPAAKALYEMGKGYWEDMVRQSYFSDEYLLTPVANEPASAGIASPLGRSVVLSGLKAGEGSSPIVEAGKIPVALAGEGTGGRLVLFSAEPEKTSANREPPELLRANAFDDFVIQSVLWLAGGAGDVRVEGWKVPEVATTGQGAIPLNMKVTAPQGRQFTGELVVHDTVDQVSRELVESNLPGNFPLAIPLPAPLEIRGPLDALFVIKDTSDNRIVAVRHANVDVQDAIHLTVSSSTGRWAFLSGEAFEVRSKASAPPPPPAGKQPANAQPQMPGALPAASMFGALVTRDGRPIVELGRKPTTDGVAAWTVPTTNLEPGEYAVTTRALDEHSGTIAKGIFRFEIIPPPEIPPKAFPVAFTFSAIPYEGAALPQSFPDTTAGLRRMIDNMMDHGVTTLVCPLPLPTEQQMEVESYAQSKGMTITYWFERGVELFKREKPPEHSIYSPAYRADIQKHVRGLLSGMDRYPRLVNSMIFGDEPFNQGSKLFVNGPEEKAEFKKRYGYDLPTTVPAAHKDPKVWLDFLDFRTSYWPDAWKQIYPIIKRTRGNFDAMLNHDSHNTFGGGVGQETKIAIDDVYHWGGQCADIYSWDIYPYLMSDFRYGPNKVLKLPRNSQMHYGFAHMRNLTESFKKKLGFWFGTYHPEWFTLDEPMRQQYWEEREMTYTAIAAGCDFLVAGLNVPIDSKHWEDFGDAMKTLHKAGPELVAAKKVNSRAAMLFPRTQYLQLQEEYWNVGQSFEAFQRAFGELDVIHEEQVAKDGLGDYKVLVLFDVKLLPDDVVKQIEKFVEAGGIVIADCVPNLDRLKKPTDAISKLFGVKDAKTDRILWPERKKVKIGPTTMSFPAATSMPAPTTQPEATTRPSDRLRGDAFNLVLDLPLVSPRPATADGAEVLVKTEAGSPGISRIAHGKGKCYLLGFCLQDTSFEAWRTSDWKSVGQINDLLLAIANDAGVKSHVRSSNGDVEAAVRSGEKEAFLLIISHEARVSEAKVWVRDLPFEVKSVVDVTTDNELTTQQDDDAIRLDVDAPTGTTKIFRLRP